MQTTIFGRTNLSVSRTGFGCIPIQRISYDKSTALLRHAYENGVTLFDTANAYTTSEERIGIALFPYRKNIVICTKSSVNSPEDLMKNIENSLRMLKTDYIDVFQLHNPPFVPLPNGDDGIYDCLLKAKMQGKILHIGITSHSKDRAKEAVLSGFFDTLQYPFSYLSSEEELEIVDLCREYNIGFLAMKGLCGGLITNAKAAFVFLRQYENVIPIWGLQEMSHLEEFLSYEKNPPLLDGALKNEIEADKKQLSGSFCRCCGYCLPCPVGIPINNAARITFLLGRAVKKHWLTPQWQDNMRLIDNCIHLKGGDCGLCKTNCPYDLDIPVILKHQQAEFFKILEEENGSVD
jgi:aryl-alcohol dehydrogenase-like predicted oxidoreductase